MLGILYMLYWSLIILSDLRVVAGYWVCALYCLYVMENGAINVTVCSSLNPKETRERQPNLQSEKTYLTKRESSTGKYLDEEKSVY